MDINQQLQSIATNLISNLQHDLEKEVREKVSAEVIKKLAETELDGVVRELVTREIYRRLDEIDFSGSTTAQLTNIINGTSEQIRKHLIDAAGAEITKEIDKKIATIDIASTVSLATRNNIQSLIKDLQFPAGSIHHGSINLAGFELTGDHIKGGIIEKFGSTGIEDLASHVQMTLMDHAVAFESSVYAQGLQIKGDAVVVGNLIVHGTVPEDSPMFVKLVNSTSDKIKETLNDDFFKQYAQVIFKEINQNGLDLTRLTNNGREIIKDNQIGYHITDSNLQRLGLVNDLQTKGETLLSESLYVVKGRAGINTLDPSAALAVWDEECELVVAKRKQDVGYIGTYRNQAVILGANKKENITLNTDGSIGVSTIKLNNLNISTTLAVPNVVGTQGQIYFNEQPASGQYIGWVCLGGARWAGFGKIE